jgi:prepilin-type N-terminal cleavage/methylation domain-containing protein
MSPLLRLRNRAGFTLVELLAATAVVGILAALLMGALPGIRQRANDAKCLGNLHTLSGAYAAYRADYNFWPSLNREEPGNPAAYGSHPWFFSLLQNDYIPFRREQREGFPCLVSSVLTCPANKANPGSRYQWTSSPYPWRPNYTTTTYWGNNGGAPLVIPGANDRVRPSVVTNPRAIVLVDSTTSPQAGYPGQGADWNKADCFLAKVHGGGANALLANGAVVRISPRTEPDITDLKYWDPRGAGQ